MPTERDDRWISRQLSAEADQHPLPLDALLSRIMPEVNASLDGQSTPAHGLALRVTSAAVRPRLRRILRPVALVRGTRVDGPPARRRRLVPVLLAAAAIVVIGVTGVIVPRLGSGHGPDAVRVEGEDLGSGATTPARTPSHPSQQAETLPAPPPAGTSAGATAGGPVSLPRSFRWTSTGPLISATPDTAHSPIGIKDPSVVYYQGKWHVFATTALSPSSYALEYLSFRNWTSAGSAPQHYLDSSGIGTGYRAAPQVFYFAPQKLWYLVYQTGNASYSTNPDISNPDGWSAPKNFFAGMPGIISQNIGRGYWVDMWVICDSANCYLFSTDINGHLYRSQTSVANFPNGMSQPVIALQEASPGGLVTGDAVYKVTGTDTYLLIVSGTSADGHAYYRSWTSTSPAGSWTPLAASENSPFAGLRNVSFSGAPWTQEIGQGEIIRDGYDQTLSISPCSMHFLYQGTPWKLGMLTLTDSACS